LVLFASLAVGALLLLVCLFVREHDYAISLGNGYRYFGAKEGLTVIDRAYISEAERKRVYKVWEEESRKDGYDPYDIGAPRVGPNVDGYRVYRNIITGHVSKPKREDSEESGSVSEKCGRTGYFIIDTQANRIQRGLSRNEWRRQLRKYGLHSEPRLLRPTGVPGNPGT
jgi:hypothetical protein